MSRGLTAAAVTASGSEVVTRTMAVELDFPSGFVRYSGSPFDITISGETFSGVGMLAAASAAEESAELRAASMTVSLSGIPGDAIALALAEAYQGRKATVWEVMIADTGLVVADPVVIFRGRMDQLDIELGETSSVRVSLTNRLADWERARVRRYTQEDQQQDYPADEFFRFVSATTEKEVMWPASSFVR
jgi:hypothetical protein